MKKTKIHIGTSGWSYKHWKEIFYPADLKTTDWLLFYAKIFNTTEINTSFYRLPKKQTVEEWVKEVPASFKFCPKMSKYLTHFKKLHEPEEPLERFFDVFTPMQKKMGPVLIQLPHFLKFNYDTVEYFYQLLKKDYSAYDFALEARHDTWLEEDSYSLMRKYDIAFVISQSDGQFPYSETVTAKNIYLRLHGPGQLYASNYNDEALQKYADMFRQWQAAGHSIWAFFNNDVFGYAFKNARRLEELIQ